MSKTIQLDARGCVCPEPVLKVKRAFSEQHEMIEIMVDNQTAVQNIQRFAQNKGYTVSTETKEDGFLLRLKK